MASSNHTAQSYIVVLKDGASSSELQAIQDSAAEFELTARRKLSPRELSSESPIKSSYNFGTFKGFNGNLCQEAVDKITTLPGVAYIEPDGFTTVPGPGSSEPDGFKFIPGSDEPVVIDNFALPSLSAISHRHPYFSTGISSFVYHKSAGIGITVYVIDTGVMTSHEQFEGRATLGNNLVPETEDTDTHGHGTHVAGSIIGKSYGAARSASVIAVKAYHPKTPGAPATCPDNRLLDALDWVYCDASRRMALEKSIINLSGGGKYSRALNQGFNAFINCGLVCIVAAGNFGIEVGGTSPASADGVISVGAVNDRDNFKRWRDSNFGASLEIFAPGVQITSCAIHSDTAIAELTGTSMACAYVSGVTAYLMSYQKLVGMPAIRDSLCQLSSKGLIPDPGSSLTPNRFLYNGGSDI